MVTRSFYRADTHTSIQRLRKALKTTAWIVGYLAAMYATYFVGVWIHVKKGADTTPKWILSTLILWILTYVVASSIMVVKSYRNTRQLARLIDGTCVRCGYDLRGSKHCCPECGDAVNNEDAGDAGNLARRILVQRVHALCLALVLVFAVLCTASPNFVASLYLRSQFMVDRMKWSLSASRFDAEVWRGCDANGSGDSPRIDMVDDLLTRHRLIGMDREGVEALLGRPTRSGYYCATDYVYHVGYERGGFIQIDPAYLVLQFSESGNVTKIIKVGF